MGKDEESKLKPDVSVALKDTRALPIKFRDSHEKLRAWSLVMGLALFGINLCLLLQINLV